MYLGTLTAAQTLPLSLVILGKKKRGGTPTSTESQESKSQGLGKCLPPQDVW